MTSHGEKSIRGNQRVPLSPIHEGRFGRMFRRLPPLAPLADDVLISLASSMQETISPPPGGWSSQPTPQPGGDNPAIPAAYTYFGQFLDHDITFDPASSLQQQSDPDALHDFRSPRYDLDSLYGSGPDDEPFQYVANTSPTKLLVEPNSNDIEDLPRNSQGIALIGDPRNDENIIVSQLQLVFLKFHNRIADEVAADTSIADDQKFAETQRRVRWHYQRVMVEDYLPRLVGPELVAQLFHLDQTSGQPEFDLRFYLPKVNAYMPIEFAAAAFRFGHSQVRGVYDLNANVTARPIFQPGEAGPTDDLRGRRSLPQGWTIAWDHFLDLPGANPQPSRLIDTKLASGLFALPAGGGSLPERNLRRGQAMSLPSGQDVARLMRAPVLSSADLAGAPEPTPLWFYVLKEAEVQHAGTRLGSVGGRTVAEVLLGLLRADKTSWVNVDPSWQPTIPRLDETKLELRDLVQYALGLT